MVNKEQIAGDKKTWEKPNFWILDTCIQGGSGINVKESTGVTTVSGNPGQAGHPNLQLSNGVNLTPNWTAAHS